MSCPKIGLHKNYKPISGLYNKSVKCISVGGTPTDRKNIVSCPKIGLHKKCKRCTYKNNLSCPKIGLHKKCKQYTYKNK